MANKKYPRTATVSLTKEDWKIIDELKRKLSLAEAPMSTTGIVKHSIRKAAGLK